MRRLDIINSVSNLIIAFKDSNLLNVIPPYSKDINPEEIMEAFQIYSKHYNKFGKNEKEILEIIKLTGLENPKFWATILTSSKDIQRDLSMQFYRGLNFAQEYLPKIIELLKQDNVQYFNNGDKTKISTEHPENKSLLTVILPEEGNEISTPDRLMKALKSINLFYKTFAIIEKIPENELSVAAIDSGSDKSFDFLGAAKVMSSVKELIIELWDRIVFYREKKLHEKLDLIDKSLPILERIKSLEKDGNIEKEQAELLRRNIITGCKDFVEAGAIIPEFNFHSVFNPRQLMSPEPKLLTSSDKDFETNSNANYYQKNYENSDNLSNEEKDLLKKILEKEAKKKDSDNSETSIDS